MVTYQAEIKLPKDRNPDEVFVLITTPRAIAKSEALAIRAELAPLFDDQLTIQFVWDVRQA